MLVLVFLILAVVFAALATAGVPQPPRFNFLSAAVAMIALAMLVGGLPAFR